MRPKACRLLFGVLVVAALFMAPAHCEDAAEAEESEDEERAVLMARKSITGTDVLVGGNLTVTIDIFNAGTSPAYAVEVTDVSDPSLELIGGSLRARFDRVDAGATVKHTYNVKPLASGKLKFTAADIKYKPVSSSGTVQVAKSSEVDFTVLTFAGKLTQHALTLGKYLTLGNFQTESHWAMLGWVAVGVVLPAALYISYQSVHEGRKRAKYQRALQEVEKMK